MERILLKEYYTIVIIVIIIIIINVINIIIIIIIVVVVLAKLESGLLKRGNNNEKTLLISIEKSWKVSLLIICTSHWKTAIFLSINVPLKPGRIMMHDDASICFVSSKKLCAKNLCVLILNE